MNQVAKLYNVNEKLGLNIRGGQQTTRVLFDTEDVDVGTTSVEFFQNFSAKTISDTNLKEGKLPSGESMVIKEISFNTLPSQPLEGKTMILNVTVGNLRVIKDYPVNLIASNVLNPSPLGLQRTGSPYIRLLTDITIPPQVTFKAELKMESTSFRAPIKFSIFFKGFGVLFNPNTSL